MATFIIPHDFLLSPGPKVQKNDLDFEYTELPEYQGRYATVLDNVFTKDECDTLVRAVEAHKNGIWEPAMINIGGGDQMLVTQTRDCGRIILDDADVADRIWARVKASVPEIEYLKGKARVTGKFSVMLGETWKMTRLNERMRFLMYEEAQYFRPHNDGLYETPDGKESSFFTLHLYLNEATPTNELEGGATTFHSYDMERTLDVDPKVGRVLIFQQLDLLHSGADVTNGIKLTLRTDLMYARVEK